MIDFRGRCVSLSAETSRAQRMPAEVSGAISLPAVVIAFRGTRTFLLFAFREILRRVGFPDSFGTVGFDRRWHLALFRDVKRG